MILVVEDLLEEDSNLFYENDTRKKRNARLICEGKETSRKGKKEKSSCKTKGKIGYSCMHADMTSSRLDIPVCTRT